MYDFEMDKIQEKFEEIFASNHLENFKVTEGYSPEFDVKCLDTGKTYEIKRDFWFEHNGNLLVEEYFNLENKIKGWIHHTTADFYVVFYTDSNYYIVQMQDVKDKFFNRDKYNIKWVCKDILQKEGFHTRNWVTKMHEYFIPEFFTTKNIKKMSPKNMHEWM